MSKHLRRTTTLGVTAALVLALATPATAADAFTPALEPAAAVEPKIAVEDAVAYEPVVVTKRVTPAPKPVTASASSGKEAEARRILAGLIKKYPILKGTTVTIGDAKGYQAIAFYKSGRIVISKDHKATLTRILNHEVWHIIDYRDNGRIDWGEKVPPRNAASYRG
jgi:hypothetical protein